MSWISLALILVQLSTGLYSPVLSHASKITFEKYPVINRGLGWRVVLIRDAPMLVVHEGFQLSSIPGNRIVSNRGVLSQIMELSACQKDTAGTPKQILGSLEAGPPVTNATTRIIMLKLATTGSSWVGGLLHDLPNVTFRLELIRGKKGAGFSDLEKYDIMERAFHYGCEDKVLCGYSNSHNQKVGDSEAANDCKLPASNVTLPLSDFVKNLKKAQFFHAINLGIAYRHWKPTAPVPQGTPCVDGGAGGTSPQTAAASMSPSSINRVPIYELYYEDMLRDKASTLKVLLAWLGVRYDLPVPKDKVVKSTPATLRGLLQNFDEIRAWLSDHSQCLLAHLLDPKGTQVMPPCSFHFNPDEDEGSLFASVARRRKDPVPTNASVATMTRRMT